MYQYTICNQPDKSIYRRQCKAIEENVPGIVEAKELANIDGGAVMIYKKDGATKLVRLLVEECTDVVFMMGQANNPAHQNLDAPVSLNIKVRIVQNIATMLEKLGKHAEVEYY